LELPTHILCIGEIEEVHVNEDCVRNGRPDVEKVRPLMYSSGTEYAYFGLGKRIAPGFKVGKKLIR
jgi:flavin reductase (DIM6/NTAB) family NADH-FMN oxidoreductase RutF